jgi:hypothetical protein
MDAQSLLEHISSDPDPNSQRVGDLTNQLLKEFHRGYPLENLRPLLRSEDERLVNTGIWVASELGEKGKPLLSEVSALVEHPSKRVRFLVIDCILLWAGPWNKPELASAVSMMDDSESAVRWKALSFLWRASREQLSAALSHFHVTEPGSAYLPGLSWLLSSNASNSETVKAALRDQDSRMRKFAVVAAARTSAANSEPLFYAASVEDPDVKDFADSAIELL